MSISIQETTLENFSTFGDLLRYLRRRVGLTQMELSIAVGYSDAQISRLEQNLRLPDIPTIQARFIPALDLEHEPKAAARLLDLAANVRREDAPDPGICPYKGLSHFDEADADLFVGREDLTSNLVERIISSTSSGSPSNIRFLAVVGASGSGKSSLVRAGLMPALRWHKKSTDWQTYVFTPTAHPLESLATVLTQDSQSVTQISALMDDLAGDSRSLHLFAKRKLGTTSKAHLLLLVDQFEELFTLCRSEEEKSLFISNLLTAASEADGPVIVVIALRADFYAHCSSHIQLREALGEHQEFIGGMNNDELRRVIEEPATRGRWDFEDGLVDLLLHDVGHEPGALPLLSHALMETWKKRRGRKMTLTGYISSGGVRGAIAESAEAVFTDQFSQEQHEIARRIFIRLSELGDETATGDTRRRASLNELVLKPEETNEIQKVLKVLADARLITMSENTVEVAHEALIREWPRLRNWLEDNREELLLHRRLIEAAQDWDTLNRDTELLFRGTRLTQAQQWANTHDDELNDLERTFITASISWSEQQEAEREAQRQRELEAAQKLAESERQRAEEQTGFAKQLSKRAAYLTGAFIVALLMAFTALYFGSQARQIVVTAQNDKRIATSRELAAASLNNINVDPERSILLALQSVSTTQAVDGTVLPESLGALHRSIISSPIRMTLTGHNTRVLSVDFSPDGKQLASIGDDGTVIIWDAMSGKILHRIDGSTTPNDIVTAQRIAYSPNGNLLASCDNNKVNMYDPNTGEIVRTLSHNTDVMTITFNSDGNIIASGSLDGEVRLWDASNGSLLQTITGHASWVEGIVFSPDGKWIATASNDATLIIWDTGTGTLLQNFADFNGVVDSIAFSPDGTQVAFSDGSLNMGLIESTSNGENTTIAIHNSYSIPGVSFVRFSPNGQQTAAASGTQAKVWDTATGRELFSLAGHSEWVMGLAFSPDGKRLASASLDGSIKIWSLLPGNETVTIAGIGAIYGTRIAYSPDGKEIAINGGDGTATLWNSNTGLLQSTLDGHDLEVMNVAFSSDGKLFATGSLDGTTIVWDRATENKVFTLVDHEDGVRDIAFSPDGTLLATGGFDGTANIWNLGDGSLVRKITGHQGLVLGVAFSPDGSQIATASTDSTAKIWSVETGEMIHTLEGHTAPLPDITYSPDGKLLATGSQDGTAIIWDAATGSQVLTLTGHSAEIQSVAFNSNGKMLATGSGDNTAKLWDVETGQEILTVPGSLAGVKSVAFSQEDNDAHLAVSSGDGIVRIYLLRIDELLSLARSRTTRSLTISECQQYLHMDQCPATP